MFQPLPANPTNGARLPRGERLKTKLATWNVPGQEPVRAATARALQTFSRQCYAQQHCAIGECAHSAISYMRLLASNDGSSHMTWIEEQLAVLRAHRLSTKRWRWFPFYLTLLALLEVGSPLVDERRAGARPACERAVTRIERSMHDAETVPPTPGAGKHRTRSHTLLTDTATEELRCQEIRTSRRHRPFLPSRKRCRSSCSFLAGEMEDCPQMLSRVRVAGSGDIFRCSGDNEFSSRASALRAKIDDVVGALDDLEAVFDNNDGMPPLDEAVHAIQKPLNVGEV
jgi:hypothetical protein